ncbi:MAG: uroporphyrinogen-III C-methyltransferase [Gammaproteobacteria bacterium]
MAEKDDTQGDKTAGGSNAAETKSRRRTPAPKPDAAAGSAAGKGAAAPGRRRPWALVVALVALLAAAAAGGFGYYLWRELGLARQDLQQFQTRTDAGLGDLRSNLNQGLQQLRQQQADLRRGQQDVDKALQNLRQLAGRDQNGWVLAEVEYLMRIANQRLRLTRDVDTAVEALSAADQRLRDLADPGLTPIRQQLANEIAALKAVPRPDIAGMALQLESLEQQSDRLTVGATQRGHALDETAAAGRPESGAGGEGWRGALKGVWTELKTLVVIRRHDQPIAPLLSPAQDRLLREILRLKLESARVALLEDNPKLFADSIKGAREWLQQRFDPHDAAVASMLKQLDGLATAEIRPKLPDISASLRSLRQRLERRGEQVHEPSPPPAAAAHPPAPGPDTGSQNAAPAPAATGKE